MSGPGNIAIFSMMKARMQFLSARQNVVAENVANVSTPDFTPKDVDQSAFVRQLERAGAGAPGAAAGRLQLAATDPRHIQGVTGGRANVSIVSSPDSESTLDGNQVVVEEQMMKLTETRMEFETMVGLYTKSLTLLRLAAKSPSR
ncbi:flagellar basal body rod protein FlgB [bacterium]|nr:flagellar basal body rod protein FlgB [bacterium]